MKIIIGRDKWQDDVAMLLTAINVNIVALKKEAVQMGLKVDDLKAAIAADEAAADKIVAALQEEITSVNTLTAQVAALQAQIADGAPITSADMQTIIDGLAAHTTALNAAIPTPVAP